MEGLEGLGLRDRTLVVLTADHGEGLRDPHNEDTHGILLYEETLRIPLLFSAPGLVPEGRSLGGVARSVDIVPTILELVGLAIPPSVQGASLAASIRSGEDPPDRPSYFETLMPREAYGWAAMKGYRTRRWKYVQAPRPELFDLEGDPREARNLAAREPRRLLEMRRGLADLEARFGRPGAGTPHRGSLDPEIVRNLEALGYVVSTAPGTAAPSNKDPKDFIEVQNDLNLAGTLMDAGRREEAMAALDRALERDPGNLEVLRRKGVAYLETGDLARAKETFLRMTSLAPSDFMAHFRLGQVYRDLAKRAQGAGKEEEAEGARADAVRSYTRALSLFPGHALSLLDLANILARQGDRERAVEMYRQSYESDPDLLEPHFNRGILLRDLGRRDEARREFEWILANRPEPEWKPLGVDTLLRDLGGPGGEPRRR